MRGGSLDRRITIQHKGATHDADYGTETIEWTAFAADIAAHIEDYLPSKAETVTQEMRVGVRLTRVQIRYRPGITSDMRILVLGATPRTLQIIAGPSEIGRRESLEFTAAEYSTAGNP